MQIKFGTDGWRGVIARDFTFDNLSLVAQATMDYFIAKGLAEKGLVVGYDRRFLSRRFCRAGGGDCGRQRHQVWLDRRLCADPGGFLGGPRIGRGRRDHDHRQPQPARI